MQYANLLQIILIAGGGFWLVAFARYYHFATWHFYYGLNLFLQWL
jgi:hypothetical protein